MKTLHDKINLNFQEHSRKVLALFLIIYYVNVSKIVVINCVKTHGAFNFPVKVAQPYM